MPGVQGRGGGEQGRGAVGDVHPRGPPWTHCRPPRHPDSCAARQAACVMTMLVCAPPWLPRLQALEWANAVMSDTDRAQAAPSKDSVRVVAATASEAVAAAAAALAAATAASSAVLEMGDLQVLHWQQPPQQQEGPQQPEAQQQEGQQQRLLPQQQLEQSLQAAILAGSLQIFKADAASCQGAAALLELLAADSERRLAHAFLGALTVLRVASARAAAALGLLALSVLAGRASSSPASGRERRVARAVLCAAAAAAAAADDGGEQEGAPNELPGCLFGQLHRLQLAVSDVLAGRWRVVGAGALPPAAPQLLRQPWCLAAALEALAAAAFCDSSAVAAFALAKAAAGGSTHPAPPQASPGDPAPDASAAPAAAAGQAALREVQHLLACALRALRFTVPRLRRTAATAAARAALSQEAAAAAAAVLASQRAAKAQARRRAFEECQAQAAQLAAAEAAVPASLCALFDALAWLSDGPEEYPADAMAGGGDGCADSAGPAPQAGRAAADPAPDQLAQGVDAAAPDGAATELGGGGAASRQQ